MPGLPAPITIDRTKSQVSDPRVPVSVSVDATGRARRLTDSRPMTLPAREHRLKFGRPGVRPGDLDAASSGASHSAAWPDERVQRMRQDVDDLMRRAPAARGGPTADPPA